MPRRSKAIEDEPSDWRYELLDEVNRLSMNIEQELMYWRGRRREDIVAQIESLNDLVSALREGANEAIRTGSLKGLIEAVRLLEGPYEPRRYMVASIRVRQELWRIRDILVSHVREARVTA